ncbi:putative RTA-like protein [Seiridium unicorne]|uniref:RTA-like protein n=1 Tax=Seiridium unicorne TaxID=138068 RepID=A0ABR2UR56_9PEZI
MTTKSFYAYDPQVAAAAVACAVFGANAIYALIQTVRKRSWVWLVMVFAIALDCFGFGVRIKSAADVTSRGLYIAQYLCIILAPVFMAGIIYVVFGRIVIHVIPARARTVKLLWVPGEFAAIRDLKHTSDAYDQARWATPIFVGCDLIALILQGAGAAIVVGTQPTDENAQDKVNRGKDIAMTGVAVQLAGFGVFSIVAARFHVISKQFASELESKILQTEGDKTVTLQDSSRRFNPHWKRILFAVNTSCALILVGHDPPFRCNNFLTIND